MNEMKLYVIFDRKAEECGPVFEAKNDAVAWRNFEQGLGQLAAPREDFQLLEVGMLNRDTARVTATVPAREVFNAVQ